MQDQDRHELCVENSFSGPESSTRRQSSSFDLDTSGYLAKVLSRVRASDFPKLDFESEQSSWSCRELDTIDGSKNECIVTRSHRVCEFTEREVRGKYEMYLRTPPIALLEPRFLPIERRFRPIVLDAVPGMMQKIAMNA